MVHYMYVLALFTLAAVAYTGTIPPSTCDAGPIRDCLSSFEKEYALCGDNDALCQCESVITSGANCYASCPQEAMTVFIKTYSDSQCAQYDPVLRVLDPNAPIKPFANAELENIQEADPVDLPETAGQVDDQNSGAGDYEYEDWEYYDEEDEDQNDPTNIIDSQNQVKNWFGLRKRKAVVGRILMIHRAVTSNTPNRTVRVSSPTTVEGAVTVTAAPDPTTTTTISPQEYQSRLEKQRYKDNLARIRRQRARESSILASQALALAAAAVATSPPSAEAVQSVPEEENEAVYASVDSMKAMERSSGAQVLVPSVWALVVGVTAMLTL